MKSRADVYANRIPCQCTKRLIRLMQKNNGTQEKWVCIDWLPCRYVTSSFLQAVGRTEKLWLLLSRLHQCNGSVAAADTVEVMECLRWMRLNQQISIIPIIFSLFSPFLTAYVPVCSINVLGHFLETKREYK